METRLAAVTAAKQARLAAGFRTVEEVASLERVSPEYVRLAERAHRGGAPRIGFNFAERLARRYRCRMEVFYGIRSHASASSLPPGVGTRSRVGLSKDRI